MTAMRLKHLYLASVLVTTPLPVLAQTSTTGSQGCSTLYQTAADAATNRISADDTNIAQPISVNQLSCLNSIFNVGGLNLINLVSNPTQIFNQFEQQICNALKSVWQKTLGNQQCGITLTGFKIGTLNFGSLGSGLLCPKLTFGGGGPPIATIGINGSGKLYVNGQGIVPTGYALPNNLGLW